MHINPGIVDGAKLLLSYATAAGVSFWAVKSTLAEIGVGGVASLALRGLIATVAVFVFFQVFPHFQVGVSEVHFILGSTLFLILGAGPAAFGLAFGLLLQGIFVAPFDLPQYAMNVTTLLVPLYGLRYIADRFIAPNTAYVDITYKQTLMLSTAYQAGIVSWVAFWVFYGQGFAATGAVAQFGVAYMMVVLIEPLVDLAVLAAAKSGRDLSRSGLVSPRLYRQAA